MLRAAKQKRTKYERYKPMTTRNEAAEVATTPEPQHPYTLPKPYLSASQISTYLRCPMQYEFRYIKGITSPPAVAMMVGSAVHSGLEMYYNDRLDKNPMKYKPEQIAEFAITSLEEEVSEKEIPLEGSEKDDTVTHINNAVVPYVNHVGPHFDPISVESEIRYISTCGVEVLGYLDLERAPMKLELEADYPDPEKRETAASLGLGNRICDHKITGKKWALSQLENSLQFHLYVMATGKHNVEIHNVVKSTKTAASKVSEADFLLPSQDMTKNIRLLRHKFNPMHFHHIEVLIERVACGISSGVFTPTDLGNWCCSERFCGYWYLCRGAK